jgi:hypothetical protein
MASVVRRSSLMAIGVLLLGGCGSGPDKQWYKPGGTYTVAEFEHDRKACTVGRQLDEACLKARGWLAVSADRETPVSRDSPPKRY